MSLPTVKGNDMKENNAYATACTVPAAPVSSQHDEILRVDNYSAWLTK